MRTVRRQGNVAWTFEEFADGTSHARLYYRSPDGDWSPPLPDDVAAELPMARSRSRGPALVRSVAARDDRPSWLLNRKEPEPWRLRR